MKICAQRSYDPTSFQPSAIQSTAPAGAAIIVEEEGAPERPRDESVPAREAHGVPAGQQETRQMLFPANVTATMVMICGLLASYSRASAPDACNVFNAPLEGASSAWVSATYDF